MMTVWEGVPPLARKRRRTVLSRIKIILLQSTAPSPRLNLGTEFEAQNLRTGLGDGHEGHRCRGRSDRNLLAQAGAGAAGLRAMPSHGRSDLRSADAPAAVGGRSAGP